MAVLGTFSTFTTARLGIYASQASLNVTGNNIANINTNGYTRQRMDLVSLNSTGVAKYATSFMVNVGYGVLCESTSQLRDPYLDIRFRDSQSDVGFSEAKLEGLNALAHFLDEVGKGEDDFGLIAANIHEFFDALEGEGQRVGTDQYDDLVRAAGSTLTALFNKAAKALETVKQNEYSKLKDDVKDINNILNNIRDLNAQIRTQGIYGESALELRDARNVQIDKLSKFMKIDVTYSMEKIDQYSEVEKLTITLADSGNPPITLVDGIYGTQFTMPEEVSMPNPAYNPSLPTSKQYIGKDGQLTDIPREAALMKNPDYNLDAPDLKKYLDKDGNPTNSVKKSLIENPAYANDNTQPKYLDDQNQPTNDETKAARRLNNTGPNAYNPDSIHAKEYIEKYETTADPADAEPMRNTDPAKYGPGAYLQVDPNDPKSYVGTDNAAVAAPMLNPDRTDKTNLYIKKGSMVATNDPGTAAKQLNPEYDPTLSSSNQYLRVMVERNPDGTPKLDQNGKPIPVLDANGKVQYEPTDNPFDPNDPDNPNNATSVPSFSEDMEANRYLFQLTALRDKDDRFMRDKYGVEIKEEPIEIGDTTLYGGIQAIRELLTEEGEFSNEYDLSLDPKATIKRGIPYYQKALDNWAQIFAKTFNEANQMNPADVYKTVKDYPDLNKEEDPDNPGTLKVDDCFLDADGKHVAWEEKLPDGTTKKHVVTSTKDGKDDQGNPIKVPKETSDYTAEELDALRNSALRREEYSFYNGGNLFSNSGDNNDATGITAKNISIANAWSNGSVRVLATKQPNEYNASTGTWTEHTGRQDNILHMIGLVDEKRDFCANVTVEDAWEGNSPFFKGSFEEMFTGISGTLATDMNSTNDIYTDYCITSLDLDNSRASVSGVDLNEEATSMMQFEKSYAAACRLLTTIDSMLDKLINGTAI